MAPESIGPLIAALTNNDVQVWALAAGALGKIGPAAKAAIPVLEKWLKDKDHDKRINAADVIGELGGDPREFVPVVIQSLPELNRDGLSYSLDILVRYKEQAKDAVPILKRILANVSTSTNMSDIANRGEIEWTIKQIDSEAASKEGIN
jgi:HEAT repeat protein